MRMASSSEVAWRYAAACVRRGRGANVLKITIAEYPNEQRWCLQGQMVGRCADELRSAWRETRQEGDARRCIVELKLTLIDRDGEAILAEIMVEGAAFIASGAYARHVLSKICVDAKWRMESVSKSDERV